MQMPQSRENHYVPKWYQRRFCIDDPGQLHRLDLLPEQIQRPDGRLVTLRNVRRRPLSRCFVQRDLYTTFFGGIVNDEIERMLFGKIDDTGARAVNAFVGTNPADWHKHFREFFVYIDAQKIRTPKGLSWLKAHYPELTQLELMLEMQAIRQLHCTLWTEGVREIVSAENSSAKFIVTDHPVTVYNYAHPPASEKCQFPFDPSIKMVGTQTLFALDKDHLLILTHYDYANNPERQDPNEDRTNARLIRDSLVRTDAFIHGRMLREEDVLAINNVLKSRAGRYVAAGREDLLFPESHVSIHWDEIRYLLLPPEGELWRFGGEMYVGYEDGTTHYQDAYGRTVPENPYLRRDPPRPDRLRKNDPCGCGSGRPYKKCCRNKSENQRPSWQELSIRERNLGLIRAVNDILGLNQGKTWGDVRREFDEEHVKRIHEVYETLWPPHTDILSLLPKPDNELRALYSGIVDPRLISTFATSVTPYFDQLLIQSPFVNPACVRPEFRPTESPHQHLYQTIKNVLVLLTLEPFIDAGFVNLFPDPCDFNFHLRRQMMNMAEERCSDIEIDGDEKELLMALGEDDFRRSLLALPRDAQRSVFTKSSPEMSNEELERVLDYMAVMKEKDPLALLREDLLGNGEGQFTMFSMAPNFELAMYIAQATGSVIVTHSQFRWKELGQARRNSKNLDGTSLELVRDTVGALEHRLTAEPSLSFHQRLNGPFAQARTALRRLVLAARPTAGAISDHVARELAHDLAAGFGRAIDGVDLSAELSFKAKIECLLPRDGLVHNNVQRLLLTSGSENHLDRIAMVFRLVPQDRSSDVLGPRV